MTFSEAIKDKDLNGLKEIVARATNIYGASVGEEPEVETAYGTLPFSAITDDETQWTLASMAYAEVITQAKYIPEEADKKVEVAKLIATNNILRAMTGETTNEVDELI